MLMADICSAYILADIPKENLKKPTLKRRIGRYTFIKRLSKDSRVGEFIQNFVTLVVMAQSRFAATHTNCE